MNYWTVDHEWNMIVCSKCSWTYPNTDLGRAMVKLHECNTERRRDDMAIDNTYVAVTLAVREYAGSTNKVLIAFNEAHVMNRKAAAALLRLQADELDPPVTRSGGSLVPGLYASGGVVGND